MNHGRAVTSLGLAGLLLLGCDAGVRGRSGLDAWLRAGSGTFIDRPLSMSIDPMVADGRKVAVSRYPSVAFPGQGSQPFSGSVRQGGRSVAVGLTDDRGYWIVPAPMLNREAGAEGELLFSSSLSFSPSIPPGAHNLALRAIGADGRMGDPSLAPVMITAAAGAGVNVSGAFQIKLRWDTNADLDLHVIVPVAPTDPPDPKAPAQIEVWNNQPSSLPPRPIFDPYSLEDLMAGGLFDYDSNAGCAIDGRQEENVVWGAPPPEGPYLVRVDTVSLCGEVDAQWRVDVFQDGNPVPVHTAFGEAIDSDARFSHTQGAGVLALEFKVP